MRTFERVDFYGPRDPNAIAGMETLPHNSPSSAELVGARNLSPCDRRCRLDLRGSRTTGCSPAPA